MRDALIRNESLSRITYHVSRINQFIPIFLLVLHDIKLTLRKAQL